MSATPRPPSRNGGPKTYTPEHRNAVRMTMNKRVREVGQWVSVAPTDEEVDFLLLKAEIYGLDPLAGQIYAVWREGRMRVESTIDGLRLLAERTKKYLGQTPVQWRGETGGWEDVWLGEGPPAAARVGVFKKDAVEPTYATVHYREFAQRNDAGLPQQMWKHGEGKPAHMLAIRAEALALRKAFPAELGGLYTGEEMPGVEHAELPPAPLAPDVGAPSNGQGSGEAAPAPTPSAVLAGAGNGNGAGQIPAPTPGVAATVVDSPAEQPRGPAAVPGNRWQLESALREGGYIRQEAALCRLLFNQQPQRLTDEQVERLATALCEASEAGITGVELAKACKRGLKHEDVGLRRRALLEWIGDRRKKARGELGDPTSDIAPQEALPPEATP